MKDIHTKYCCKVHGCDLGGTPCSLKEPDVFQEHLCTKCKLFEALSKPLHNAFTAELNGYTFDEYDGYPEGYWGVYRLYKKLIKDGIIFIPPSLQSRDNGV